MNDAVSPSEPINVAEEEAASGKATRNQGPGLPANPPPSGLMRFRLAPAQKMGPGLGDFSRDALNGA